MSCCYLHSPPLGYQASERVPKNWSYTQRLLIRIVTSVRQGDKNKYIQYPRGISGQRRKLSFIEVNVAQKFAVLLAAIFSNFLIPNYFCIAYF